jgi:signal peptidase I
MLAWLLGSQTKGQTTRQQLLQMLQLMIVVSSAYMTWKAAGLVLNTESPIVVVLSGSMEPLFYRGDILFLYRSPYHATTPPSGDKRAPDAVLEVGEITVYKLAGKDIPIVHRVVASHHTPTAQKKRHREVEYVLTKGDNNGADDRGLYNTNQDWLHERDIMGKVVGYIPYVGMLTIWMNDYPLLKYALLAALAIYTLTHREQ